MRRILAALLLIVGLASASYALSPAASLILNSGCANGAGVVLDFTAGTACGTSFSSVVTVRNSVAYEDDLSGNWFSFAVNTLRQTNKGALIEESRTNSIRNNSMQGAVAGSPGTIPTNWLASTSPTNGISMDVIGTGTENGIDYIDLKFSGVATSGSTFIVNFEAANQAVASSGQTWTASLFSKLVGGDYTGISSSTVQVVGTNGVSGLENGSQAFTATSAALGTQRAANVYLLANASTTNARPRLLLNYTNGSTVNITLRIGWPQLELGAFVTSPIRTTNAAVLRAADFVTVSSFPNFGMAQTLYAQGVPTVPVGVGANQSIFSISDGSATNRTVLFRVPSAGQVNALINSAGNTVQPGLAGPAPANARAKLAVAAAIGASQGILAWNGTLSISTSPVAVISSPTVTLMNIGNNGTNLVGQWNGYVEQVAAWPNTRLPNATLQRLTAP